jgi:molybdopterin molybdotransferase
MGDYDIVRDVLDGLGVTWHFWKVRQRPGKPLAFGTLGGRPVLGLPGNPVSAAVGFEVYARPLLAAALGRPEPLPSLEAAILDAPVTKAEGLHTFARVTARRDSDGRLRLRPAGAQGSHVARSLLDADGLAHLPAAWPEAPAGAEVAFERWAWR